MLIVMFQRKACSRCVCSIRGRLVVASKFLLKFTRNVLTILNKLVIVIKAPSNAG